MKLNLFSPPTHPTGPTNAFVSLPQKFPVVCFPSTTVFCVVQSLVLPYILTTSSNLRRLSQWLSLLCNDCCCYCGWKNSHRWTSLLGAPIVMRRLVKSFSRFQNVRLAGGVMFIVANLADFTRLSADVADVLMSTFLKIWLVLCARVYDSAF